MSSNSFAKMCPVCKSAGKSVAEYTSHHTKSEDRKTVVCPILLSAKCTYCEPRGFPSQGHTPSYCPIIKGINAREQKLADIADKERRTVEFKKKEEQLKIKNVGSSSVVGGGFAALLDSSSEDEAEKKKEKKRAKKELKMASVPAQAPTPIPVPAPAPAPAPVQIKAEEQFPSLPKKAGVEVFDVFTEKPQRIKHAKLIIKAAEPKPEPKQEEEEFVFKSISVVENTREEEKQVPKRKSFQDFPDDKEYQQKLSEQLYWKVDAICPAKSGKITGILLESYSDSKAELDAMLYGPEILFKEVQRALAEVKKHEDTLPQQEKKSNWISEADSDDEI